MAKEQFKSGDFVDSHYYDLSNLEVKYVKGDWVYVSEDGSLAAYQAKYLTKHV